MKLTKILSIILLAGVLLAACAPGARPDPGAEQTPQDAASPTAPAGPTLTPWDKGISQPPSAEEAQQALADALGISLDAITLVEVEEVEWPNACLGLPEPGEMCAEVLTPGFRLVFEAGGERYEAHTNRDGSQVRFAGGLQGSGPGETPAGDQDIPAVAAAIDALVNQSGFSRERVRVVEASPEEWPDGCLGAGGPAESCLQVITPGYLVILEVDGTRYEVRTNRDGSLVRIVTTDGQGGLPGGGTGELPALDPTAIANLARNLLAHQLGIPADEINLVIQEAVDWPDACLGAPAPGQVCAQVITPGYRFVFEAQGVHYAFHTDQAGGKIVPAVPPLPETAGTVIMWRWDDGTTCWQAEVGAPGVAAGNCGEPAQSAALSSERLQELAYLYASFSSFEAETPAGTVQFNGQGSARPAEAEMRSVAEWVNIVVQETAGGDVPTEPAIEWSREGGIAGFCDEMAVSRGGWAQPATCRGGRQANLLPRRLSAEELEQLYAWTDRLESFEYEQSDGAVADSMTIRLVFRGSGDAAASESERAEIARFAESLLSAAR